MRCPDCPSVLCRFRRFTPVVFDVFMCILQDGMSGSELASNIRCGTSTLARSAVCPRASSVRSLLPRSEVARLEETVRYLKAELARSHRAGWALRTIGLARVPRVSLFVSR